jgi:hypothetical protein
MKLPEATKTMDVTRVKGEATSSSLVLELQALAQATTADLLELLRRAKVVAVKLVLDEPARWIDRELNGYPAGTVVPPYRRVPSALKAYNPYHGLIPVEFKEADVLFQHFSSIELRQPMGEVVEFASRQGGRLEANVSPSELAALHQAGADFVGMTVVRIISQTAVAAILDAVRNQILSWSLELERQGILGEGMTFSSAEREKAASAITVNHINYGPVIHGDNAQVATAASGSSTIASNAVVGSIASGTGASATGQVQQTQVNDLPEVRKLVEIMLGELQQVPEGHRGDLLEHGTDLEEEVAKDAPKKSKLKATLAALGTGIPAVITWAPKAVEAFEKIKRLLGH